MARRIGPTAVVVRNSMGTRVIAGPFTTDAEVDDLRQMLAMHGHWTIELTGPLISGPQIQGVQELVPGATECVFCGSTERPFKNHMGTGDAVCVDDEACLARGPRGAKS